MKERIILHCDANSFYASVECALHPEYKGKPLAVSGNPEKRTGIILAKNDIAKPYGIKTGEAIWEAKEKCPDLICIFPHHDIYEEYSKKLHEIYATYTHLIEPFGIDECWLDVTETAHLFGGALNLAEDIRKRVKNELNITVSIGVSFSKLFAKLGSDIKKPDAITCLPRDNFKALTYLLPVSSIVGIGRRMKVHLEKMNVTTIGDLAHIPTEILEHKFGVVGRDLSLKVRGVDYDPVKSMYDEEAPKSVGNGTTTIVDIFTPEEVQDTVFYLAEEVGRRLREKKLLSSTISVTIKTCEFNYEHHSNKTAPTNSTKEIAENALALIRTFWNYSEKIRAIRICCSSLSSVEIKQLSMFEPVNYKKSSLSLALDILRAKYGESIIKTGSLKAVNFLR